MALALVRSPDAWTEADPADDLIELFGAAPHSAGGWTRALEGLRTATSSTRAALVAEQGGSRWTVAESRMREHGDEETSGVPFLAASGVAFALHLSRDGRAAPRLAGQRLLGRLAAGAAGAVRVELGIRAAALQMTLDLLSGAGLRPLVCTPDGRLADGTRAEDLPGAGPLRLSAGRIAVGSRRDEEALRAALAEAAVRRRCAAVALGADRDAPMVLDILPPLERHGACFLQQVVVLPRMRAARGAAEREPLVQQLFGLTPSEAAVATGIADGVSIGELAERRGVAASTVRGQVKSILGKVGVGRQVELAHRLAMLC